MAVTLKDLARAAGVSVGTVSRALNEKDEVSAGTSGRIRRLALEMGYVPNRAGRALSARKSPHSVGVLLPSLSNPFFDDIKRGVKDAAFELKDLGPEIVLHEIKGWDGDEHAAVIDKLADKGCKALAVCSPDVPAVRDRIRSLKLEGVSTLALNASSSSKDLLCYVGIDYKKSGEIAAALMCTCHRAEKMHVLVVTGFNQHAGHAERVQGFVGELQRRGVDHVMSGIIEGRDSDILTQRVTMEALLQDPEINFIYMASGMGVSGLGAALIADSQRPRCVVACDELYTTKELVRSDIIDFVICQDPYLQGTQAVRILHEHLSGPKSASCGDFIVPSVIKLKNHFL